jgi:bifunctional UDP-N-acetylglucosamine pyrophosphorylase / glucosamine-1-phosphate N-acetyltransferase
MKNDVSVIILAAGDGKRMKSDLPKVMHELHGKPIIGYIVDHCIAAGITKKPVIVVSPKSDLLRSYLGERVDYAVQTEQLGTGHATSAAESVVIGQANRVVVLYGDLPFLKGDSIKRLIDNAEGVVTMFTTRVKDFEGENSAFYSYGRIIRDQEGHVESITEIRDCFPEQCEIKELNTGLYSFDSAWLWGHLKQLNNENAQEEYYLTDLIAMAIIEGESIHTVDLDPVESFGITSQEDLTSANSRI